MTDDGPSVTTRIGQSVRSGVNAAWLDLPRRNIGYYAVASTGLTGALTIGVSWRLGVLMLLLLFLVGVGLLLADMVERFGFPLMELAATTTLGWLQDRDNRIVRSLHMRLEGLGAELPMVALLALAVMGGIWLFGSMLEDVVSGDPLVLVDQRLFEMLQALRSPYADAILVIFTELGDRAVVTAVVITMSIGFVVCGRWQVALYLVLAAFGSTVFVFGMKLVLHRPRPMPLYDGVSNFSFPSGHATSSMVVYGFLAIVLARSASSILRRILIMASLSLILLIAFSRLYLGAHWLSDVGAGLSFGTAWIAALAIIYFQRNRQPLPSGILVGLLVVTMVVAGAWHVGHSYGTAITRYAPS